MDDTDHKSLKDLWYKYVKNYNLFGFYPGNFVNTNYHDLKSFP